jgi:hypothetical protein
VNYLRWGSPLTFMDLRLHIQFINNPDRLAALNSFGELSPLRLPFSVLYYLFGSSEILRPLFGDPGRLYDKIEKPLSALVLTDGIPLVLAVLGTVRVFGRAVTRSYGDILLAGVLLAELAGIGFLLAANYIAMRYRMDFVPATSFAAAIGYFTLVNKSAVSRRVMAAVLLLMIGSVIASHVVLVEYKEELIPFRVKQVGSGSPPRGRLL